jgi:hypothetical protein
VPLGVVLGELLDVPVGEVEAQAEVEAVRVPGRPPPPSPAVALAQEVPVEK